MRDVAGVRPPAHRTGWLMLAALLAACGSGSGSGATISTAHTNLGTVLSGPDGNTLYVLIDSSGKPGACTGGCLTAWPPLTGSASAGSGVSASFSTTSAPDGSSQVTVNGNPLYYFAHDTGPGQANGEGIKAPTGTWYAVNPDGSPLTSAQPGSGGQPSTGGYPSY